MTSGSPLRPAREGSWVIRTLRHPLLWALLTTAGALGLHAAGVDGFFVFLLTLVTGWLCGYWFVGRTLDPRWGVWGAVAHVAAAILFVPALWAAVEVLPGVLSEGPVAAGASLMLTALAPAAGWVWITLISRITQGVRQRDVARAPAPPSWDSDGEGSVVRFAAIPMRQRDLALAIAGVTIVAGLIAVVAIIASGDAAERLGPRILIIVFGVALGLPAYLALMTVLRRRTQACSVRFVRDRLRIEVGEHTHEWRMRDIDALEWRTDGDDARVVVRAGADAVSIIVGIARQQPGVASALPALTGKMTSVLAGAGLTEVKRKGMTTVLTRSA